jgi:hypothetical protein
VGNPVEESAEKDAVKKAKKPPSCQGGFDG